jgi:aspartate-semialdehyde dehydrogenase
MALALKPIYDAFGLAEVHVSTYQALSGAGYPGVPSLDILGNVIPFIDGEEEKMESEPRKILGAYSKGKFQFAEFPVVASCVRVAVKDGHLETVTLKTKRPCNAEDIARVLRDYKGRINELKLKLPTAPATPILVSSGKNRPQPSFDVMAGTPERAKGMAVTVGRIKKVGEWIRIILLSNNVIRGAVGGSVVNAEIAYQQKYL